MSDINSLKNDLESVRHAIEDKNRTKASAQNKLADVSKLNGSELSHYTQQFKNVTRDIEELEKKKDELETKIETLAKK